MAPRIPPKEATLITTLFSALVGTGAVILISSIYVKDSAGWPQFCLNAFSAVAVCTIGASALGYAAHQQFVVKKSLFADHDDEFDYGSIGQWAGEYPNDISSTLVFVKNPFFAMPPPPVLD